MQGVDGTLPEGKALPVASAWLQVASAEQTQSVPAAATHVTFRMPVEKGSTQVKTWWFDSEGRRLAGAYYLTAERLG